MRRRTLLATAGGSLLWPSAGETVVHGTKGTGSGALGQNEKNGGPGGSLGQIDTDRTRITLALRSDGRANWELELWTRLDSDDAESAFESLRTDVEEDPSSVLDQFRTRMLDTVAAADDATDREMTARDFAVRTETRALPQEYGLLVYSFVWEGFAAVDGATLQAGDAIDGLLLESGTRLSISWPAGYILQSVDPSPDTTGDRAVAWKGDETDFLAGQPRLVVSKNANSGNGDDTPWPLVGGSVLGTLGLAGLLWWYHHSDDRSLSVSTDSDGGATTARQSNGASTEAGEAASTGTGEQSGGKSTSGEDDEPPAELLSNEERVLGLLEENGGRMKQQQVVAELDWTEAKTSQVVTTLREEERIEVFRIGRENVLALPGKSDI